MPFPWITVFNAGTHATSAPKKTWTEADIDTIVASTRKSGNELIPFVGGHPKNNLPVFGYFSRDSIRKSTYNGKPSIQVQPAQFAEGGFEALSSSEYDKMSISVDKGVIDHIGFVKNPAVKDLPPLGSYQFSAAEDSEDIQAQFAFQTSFEYTVVNRLSELLGVLQRLRDDMIATDGNTDRADKIMPKETLDQFTKNVPQLSDDLQWLIADEVRKQLKDSKPEQPSLFEDRMDPNKQGEGTPSVAADTSATTAQFEARMAALETENKRLRTEAQTAKFSAIVDKCISDKKVTPAERELHIETMTALSGIDSAQFSDGAKSPLDKYIEGLNARTPLTGLFSEVATGGVAAPSSDDEDDKAIEAFNKSRSN